MSGWITQVVLAYLEAAAAATILVAVWAYRVARARSHAQAAHERHVEEALALLDDARWDVEKRRAAMALHPSSGERQFLTEDDVEFWLILGEGL